MSEPRVAVVTGGMTGIGLATVQALMAAGHKVAVGARRADEKDSVDAFRSTVGETPLLHGLDVGSISSVTAFVEATEAELGPVDILVNNAGTSTHQFVEGHDEADWLRVIDVNLSGPFRMIRACITGMKARKWGRIVNVASTAARTAMPDYGAYCASKSGLLGLTRAVALEGAPHGVTCTSVSPTWVETDMLRGSAAEAAEKAGISTAEEISRIAQSNPQNRLVQAHEVAALIAFACSDTAPALTMEDIQVNAGANW